MNGVIASASTAASGRRAKERDPSASRDQDRTRATPLVLRASSSPSAHAGERIAAARNSNTAAAANNANTIR